MPGSTEGFDRNVPRRSARSLFFAAVTGARRPAIALALLLAGCATRYIPNTDVEDTEENRTVITFVERYRHAVELKDVGELLKLASNEYYEDGGNIDASDDLDYSGLRDYLTTRFIDAQAIRYEIRYRRIVRQPLEAKENGNGNGDGSGDGDGSAEPRELIYVDYTYSASYRIPSSKGGDEWRRRVDDNRLEILRYPDNTFRIVAGM